MVVFALLVIAICVVVIVKAHQITEGESTSVFIEERTENWTWPAKWNRRAGGR